MLIILFILSLIVNVLVVYMYRNWEYRFKQKLLEDTKFKDSGGNVFYLKKGDDVNVHIQRKNDHVYATVGTNAISFSVTHPLKKEDSDLDREKAKGDGE